MVVVGWFSVDWKALFKEAFFIENVMVFGFDPFKPLGFDLCQVLVKGHECGILWWWCCLVDIIA